MIFRSHSGLYLVSDLATSQTGRTDLRKALTWTYTTPTHTPGWSGQRACWQFVCFTTVTGDRNRSGRSRGEPGGAGLVQVKPGPACCVWSAIGPGGLVRVGSPGPAPDRQGPPRGWALVSPGRCPD